jgi:hypothetical protein
MAIKNTPKNKKSKATKTTKAKKTTNPKKTVEAIASRKTLKQRLQNLRIERQIRKSERLRHKQTEEARIVKAENRAIREKALEQVNEAVIKSKRRKSRPALTLLLSLILVGLGAAAAYQYRQLELDDKKAEISELQSDMSSFQVVQASIEAAKQVEAEKFKTISLDSNATIRVPRGWELKDTSFPLEEQIIGNNNVAIKIVSSDSRNSISQYIPTVDYLWTITNDSAGAQLRVQSQSLHCERFDTLSNDLNDQQREHQGFTVFCDTNSERVQIAALAAPEKYGVLASNTYFIISVEDVQQVDFDSLVEYLESYSQ